MGLVDKPAFTAGELDPALWERTNLDKYRNGLSIGRNWIISKDGSILTRQGRQNFSQCKLPNRSLRLYSPPGSGVLLEWGHQYVRIYSLTTWLVVADLTHPFLESDLLNIHFNTSGSFVYIFCVGKNALKLNYATGVFVGQSSIFALPPAPTGAAITTAGTPTGYLCDYVITYMFKGEESLALGAGTASLPIAAGQTVSIVGTLCPISPGTNQNQFVTEMRVYRRPSVAGAYGFVGSTTAFTITAGNITAKFTDVGAGADYTHSFPTSLMAQDPNYNGSGLPWLDPGAGLLSNTGIIYQQRLLLSDSQVDLEAIYASQPGFQDNFFRNYPLDAASALKFKCGTSGYARILRMLDSDGLVAFTSAGIYLNQGALTPDNITMSKKGKWIIDPIVPPLPVPGGVFFVDSMTNGVRNLLWSFQQNAYDADELSIYSNHLFRTRSFRTWFFQQGYFPLLWVNFSDGSYASFTFDYNQQMQAWTRHDSAMFVESGCGTTNSDQSFFVVEKVDSGGNVQRYIEVSLPRYVPPIYIETDPDYDKNASCAYMDGITTGEVVMNNNLKGTDGFTFAPATSDPDTGLPDWTGPLNLDCGTSGIFIGTLVTANSIYRFFDEDGSVVDVKLLSVVDTNHVQVQVDNIATFPSKWATGAKLYWTFTTITGLNYLEGEFPAVIVDGAVVCSPNNDQENYPQLQVSGGTLVLPKRAAICHVGRPIIGDLETLDIDTVEQQPTLLESLVVNKVYVKVKDAKSLYLGPRFPQQLTDGNGEIIQSANGVTGMYFIDRFPVDYTLNHPVIGNRAQPSQTKRYEVMTDGDYSQQGKICVRQVDPVHAEILSFIPDVEVQKREDR